MHSKKTGIRGLILVLAGLVALAAIAVVPTFGGGATQAGPAGGINLNRSAAITEFIIPGVPVTETAGAVPASGSLPATLLIAGDRHLFPDHGELLLGKTELIAYANKALTVEVTCNKGLQDQTTSPSGKGDATQPPWDQWECIVPTAVGAFDQVKINIDTTATVDADGKPSFFQAANVEFVCVDDARTQNGAFKGIDENAKGAGLHHEQWSASFSATDLDPNKCANNTDDNKPNFDFEAWVQGNAEPHPQVNGGLAGNSTSPCGTLTKNQICVTQRAKVGIEKANPTGTLLQLATQLTAPVNATNADGGDAVQCDLGATISPTAQPPFTLTCTGSAAAFGAGPDFLTVQHSSTVAPNPPSEYMGYDLASPCGLTPTLGADQVCIQSRNLQPGNTKYVHLADGFTIPCVDNPNDGITCTQGTSTGSSIVTKHFQLSVKSNAGFFPTAPLVIYTIDSSNNIEPGAEIINYNNAAKKIKKPKPNEFHAVGRGGFKATLQPTDVSSHPAGSIVTGAHGQLVCRNGTVQPGVDTIPGGAVDEPAGQLLGTSVAIYPVCYTRTQPGTDPKTFPGSPDTNSPKKLQIPIIGSTLIVLNAVGVPFLSTGGLPTSILGPVPLVDDNGTDDGSLVLTSPCIVNFTPNTNLKVDLTLDTSDNSFATADPGVITVVLDTITGPGGGTDGDPLTHDDCDDPAGVGTLLSTTYSWYDPTFNESGGTADGSCGPPSLGGTDVLPADDEDGDFKTNIFDADCYDLRTGFSHDTDGDGCSDLEELNPNVGRGGLRDPWNGFDYYDVNVDGDIDVPNDILQVILAYLQSPGDPQYTAAKDRGGAFGPFAHNRAEPDNIIEVPNDILPVILQYLNNCTDGP